MATKPMTRAQKDRLARSFRLMAGRMYYMLSNGTAERAGAKGAIQGAHDALCHVFRKLED